MPNFTFMGVTCRSCGAKKNNFFGPLSKNNTGMAARNQTKFSSLPDRSQNVVDLFCAPVRRKFVMMTITIPRYFKKYVFRTSPQTVRT